MHRVISLAPNVRLFCYDETAGLYRRFADGTVPGNGAGFGESRRLPPSYAQATQRNHLQNYERHAADDPEPGQWIVMV